MIFVIKSDKKFDDCDVQKLHKDIYKDYGKHQVVILPEGCTYDVIYNHDVEEVKVTDERMV